ncbi:hypothetical protein O181_009515 [Austropuccinia psidii MF-1]|uniref:Reverse transcriptase Ty1/copia-type domain-containing protein n=1 Tax=Austropuccinia psidii MF-1 TaxID=1389203 RepID=A0A9Q3BS41_9BASI|nr:hypothetical protein [Austropuccinia psidii MF-1]
MAAFIHNHLLNSRTAGKSPFELLFQRWLLWDPVNQKTIQSNSVSFPEFNTKISATRDGKGHLSHVLNFALREFPTEKIQLDQENAVLSLPITHDITVRTNFKNAMMNTFCVEWLKVCSVELEQLKKRGVYVLVDRSPHMKFIGHQWVFDVKCDSYGLIKKFKAFFCACGDSQHPGIDCGETYAPTASLLCLCLLLTVSNYHKWSLASFDVSGAYLYSPVDEEIFVSPPVTLNDDFKGKVFLLQKALYGIQQAGRCWWLFFSSLFLKMGFIASEIDSESMLNSFHDALQESLEIKWSSSLTKIVGIQCTTNTDEIRLSQPLLIRGILSTYTRPIIEHKSPMSTIGPETNLQCEENHMDATPYCSFIGSLSYLVAGTRPDMAFTVNKLARYSTSPCVCHWLALDHLMGYLLRTQDCQLSLLPMSMNLDLWTDAGWGGSLERSHSGGMIKLGDCPIFWNSKKQHVVALSTCAAEYIALSDATQYLVQAINHLNFFVSSFQKRILCDNKAALGISSDALSRKCTQYLNRAFFLSMTLYAS